MITRIKAAINQSADNRLIKNIGWLSGGMFLNRILRLLITVVVARTFGPEDYGLIALIFTAHEIIGFFIQRCTQVKLIQAPVSELKDLCETTHCINWILGFCLLGVQIITAFLLSHIYDAPELLLPIVLLGFVHVQLPFAMVHAGLNFRDSKLKLVAKIEVAQTFLETALVLLLIALGAGIWSVVIPKLITPVVWVIGHRKNSDWRSQRIGALSRWKEVVTYSSNLIMVDGLQILRQNIDYFLVGFFLGVDVLGLYYFAYNAGLGIASSFGQSISTALLPHFCEMSERSDKLQQRFRKGLQITAIIMGVILVLQASLATLYVPIIFGENWVERGAVPLIIILCVVALPKAVIDACSQYLRASDQAGADLKHQTIFSIFLIGSVVVSVAWGLVAVAIATVVAYLLYATRIAYVCLSESPSEKLNYQNAPDRKPGGVRDEFGSGLEREVSV